jgi:hypothetical protein
VKILKDAAANPTSVFSEIERTSTGTGLTVDLTITRHTLDIVGASWAGGTATYTTREPHGLTGTPAITITGLAPSGLNAPTTVGAVTGIRSFTCAIADPGTITDQRGTVTSGYYSVATATINNPGSGHTLGDIYKIDGSIPTGGAYAVVEIATKATTSITWAADVVTLNFATAHNLAPADTIVVSSSDTAIINGGANPANWTVASTPSATQLTYALAGGATVTDQTANVYCDSGKAMALELGDVDDDEPEGLYSASPGTTAVTTSAIAAPHIYYCRDVKEFNDGAVTATTVLPTVTTRFTESSEVKTLSSDSLDYQEFTADGTWTKPAFASATSRIYVELIGGGGGGGGGARVAAAGTATGGAGGGAGNSQNRWIRSTDLTSTVAITIGLGGAGGAGGASEPSAGSNGVAGGNTSFGSYLTSYGGGYGSGGSLTQNSGGGGGGGWAGAGTNGAPNATGTGGTGGGSNGGNGIAGSSANSNTTGGAGGSGCPIASGVATVGGGGNIVAGGGSAGGGVLVGVAKAGADSPVQTGYTSVAGGAATGAAGTAANAAVISPYGTSGGGGGANGAGVGGAAGAGTGYGAGGSGGGAAIGGAGGAGAAGLNGIIRVWTYA